jgi:putative hydroxymethylpyrimidine transport system ATP-binding protein
MQIKPPSISLQHIHLSYGKDVLFDDLNLTLAAGKWTCLLGPSGVGKSTLLKLISGLIPSNMPQERYHGHVHSDHERPLAEHVAYMAQTDLLLPWFSALDNALLGAKLRGSVSDDLRIKAKQLFAEVDLSHVENKLPHQLSGGMRQRVAMVRTLLEDKPIVVMDEPFSAVDAITRFQLQTLAATLLKNRTVFLVTHDPLEALRLADDIYILSGLPATLALTMQLHTPIPRDVADPELMQHQATLFHALMRAKEISP